MRRGVDQVVGAGFHELRAGAEPPRNAHRAYAGGCGRLHVDARVADEEHPVARHGHPLQNLLRDGRIGFQGHAFALAQHGGELHVGKEACDELRGACLELVRGHGEPHTPGGERAEQLRNALVGARPEVDVRGVVLHEVAAHGGDGVGRSQGFGQGALHEAEDAVAYETAILLVGVLRQTPEGQCRVACDGQVADGVEQGAVEVEDREFGHG